MEFFSYEASRVVYLAVLTRPQGQLYLPEAAEKTKARYSFTRAPESIEEVKKERAFFSHGKFGEIAIDEFSIYRDGLVISSYSHTDQMEAFLKDFLKFAIHEFGAVHLEVLANRLFFDSQINVRCEKNMAKFYAPLNPVAKILNERLRSYGGNYEPFEAAGISLDIDAAKQLGRKPTRFGFERKLGVPFDSNVYYSVAPLRTGDHLALLADLERLL